MAFFRGSRARELFQPHRLAKPPSPASAHNDDVFHKLYTSTGPGSGPTSTPEYTEGFRNFLQQFLANNAIASVLDYGCGDWKWASLIDWNGIDYLGVDIVDTLIEELRDKFSRPNIRFETVHAEKPVLQRVDLIICKDVLQHLPNQEALAIVRRLLDTGKLILFCNDSLVAPIFGQQNNIDIVRGGSRPLDLRQPPFYVPGKTTFRFGHKPENKVAFLWSEADGKSSLDQKTRSMKVVHEMPTNVKAIASKIFTLRADEITADPKFKGQALLIHNPSIAIFRGKPVCIVRLLHTGRRTNFNVIGQPILNLDDETWSIHNLKVLEDNTPGIRSSYCMTSGYEDCRLFSWTGQDGIERLWASATICDRIEEDPLPKISVIEIDFEEGAIARAHVQPSSREEKNWMPVVNGNQLRFIYSIEPRLILDFNPETGLTKPYATEVSLEDAVLRGGSQLQPYRDGYLAIIHQVHERGVYLHRFICLNQDLQLTSISQPFYFNKIGIEFCAGLMKLKNYWVASFGASDKQACLAFIKVETVDGMMEMTP